MGRARGRISYVRIRLALVRAGLSWTEAGDLDLVTASQVLEIVTGRKAKPATTYVSRRKKKPPTTRTQTRT